MAACHDEIIGIIDDNGRSRIVRSKANLAVDGSESKQRPDTKVEVVLPVICVVKQRVEMIRHGNRLASARVSQQPDATHVNLIVEATSGSAVPLLPALEMTQQDDCPGVHVSAGITI